MSLKVDETFKGKHNGYLFAAFLRKAKVSSWSPLTCLLCISNPIRFHLGFPVLAF